MTEHHSDPIMSHILRSLETLNNSVQAVDRRVGETQAEVAALKATIEAMPTCPNPGECATLRERVNALDAETDSALAAIRADVDEHRLLVAKINGGWKMLTILVSVCSTLGGVIGWGLSHFSK